MPTRTTETTVTFRHSFTLAAVDGVQPAGTYRLVTDEELISELSFVAFRRMSTMLHLPATPSPGCRRDVVCVDPVELAEALKADAS
ncbi:hypothetical protein [Reyranella sp.]|uniref:hypothetical protein n=1 Tax=Reyranella sp. TaxID=1929291 RepID=UPI0011F862A7|nr:hypothetical protein [Reyranella sp.]TAJ82034.1 MAG: hypothetical protein EPO50_28380 [Reyranella sp.]